jgi:hypothetical protein
MVLTVPRDQFVILKQWKINMHQPDTRFRWVTVSCRYALAVASRQRMEKVTAVFGRQQFKIVGLHD